MSLTTKQIVFFLLFLFSWLLLLLLGESYLSYVLLGGVSLFFLLFANELEWKKANYYKWSMILWLLFLFSVGFSLAFSISLPISIHSVARYIFIFLTFWFFILVKKSFVSSQQIIKLLLLTSLVITLVSVSFQFFPNLANLLPGMNLLHATYGHNHLAALLLLVIPLSWWLASDYIKVGRSYWWLLLPLTFNLGLLFSFGRVAVSISLVQFLFINQQLKKNNFFKKRYFSFIFKTLASLFLIVLLSNIFFSTMTLINPSFSCPVPSLKRQLCKSIEAESRPKYWSWAGGIIKNNPLLGSGPGTFAFAAKKHRLTPYNATAYAHNAFLQSLAEMGLIGGGLFIVLMFGLLFFAWKNIKQKRGWSWQKAAFLGVVAIYADVLFDFDWSFVGILGITIVLLSLLIKDGIFQLTKKSLASFLKTSYLIFIFSLILMAGLYSVTDYLIRVDRTRQAFQLFPYFYWHRKIYETSPDLNDRDWQKLFNIYAAHSSIYPIMLSQNKDNLQRQQIKEKWFEVDPWSAVTKDMISYYLDQQDWAAARYWLELILEMYAYSTDDVHELDYRQIRLKLDDQKLSLAEGYLENDEFQRAFDWLSKISEKKLHWDKREPAATLLVEVGNRLAVVDMEKTVKAYSLAKEHSFWILSINDLWFEQQSSEDLKAAELIKYLQLTASWKGESMGWKDEQQQFLQQNITLRFLSNGDWENLITALSVISWDQHDYEWKLELLKNISESADILVKKNNYQLASDLLQSAQSLMPGDYWLAVQPANLAILTGDLEGARQFYQKCLDSFPDSRHSNCHYGLQLIEREKINPDRYWEVSQIIRGEAVWQDFN